MKAPSLSTIFYNAVASFAASAKEDYFTTEVRRIKHSPTFRNSPYSSVEGAEYHAYIHNFGNHIGATADEVIESLKNYKPKSIAAVVTKEDLPF